MKLGLFFAASLFASAAADACDRADKLRSIEACADVSGCSWCTPTDLIQDRPFCVANIGAAFVPKQLFTCAAPPKISALRAGDDCDDDDNDICDLHKTDQVGCISNPMCTWCISSGLVPATPDCVLVTDAPWIPKQIYSCAPKVENAKRAIAPAVSGTAYTCSKTVNSAVTINYSYSSGMAHYEMIVKGAVGYVGLGFPSRASPLKMAGGEAVIGSFSLGVFSYDLAGTNVNQVLKDGSQVISGADYVAGSGSTILRFSRTYNNGGAYSINPTGSNPMIWAFHATSATLAYHGGNRGAVDLPPC